MLATRVTCYQKNLQSNFYDFQEAHNNNNDDNTTNTKNQCDYHNDPATYNRNTVDDS